jgi:catechol 2,3-dioxygenase-like lactoylglutathione lyase family enzyme
MLSDAPLAAILPAGDIERSKRFYAETLGLRPAPMPVPPDGAAFESGNGTLIYLYQRNGGAPAEHTVAGWLVPDVEAAVQALRARGVAFEQYDLPGLKTDERGISERPGAKSAWFKDSEGNTLAITELPD